MQHPVSKGIVTLLLFSFLAISCDSTDPFSFTPPDFTTVPNAFDISGVSPVELESGIMVYELEEGAGPFEITARDTDVQIYLTVRTEDGEVIYSTFANGRTSPNFINVSSSGNFQQVADPRQHTILMIHSPGLKRGLIGMKESQVRTLRVEPEQAFANVPSGHAMSNFRDDTIIYDIRVSRIDPS